jgi:hypothetical protein
MIIKKADLIESGIEIRNSDGTKMIGVVYSSGEFYPQNNIKLEIHELAIISNIMNNFHLFYNNIK